MGFFGKKNNCKFKDMCPIAGADGTCSYCSSENYRDCDLYQDWNKTNGWNDSNPFEDSYGQSDSSSYSSDYGWSNSNSSNEDEDSYEQSDNSDSSEDDDLLEHYNEYRQKMKALQERRDAIYADLQQLAKKAMENSSTDTEDEEESEEDERETLSREREELREKEEKLKKKEAKLREEQARFREEQKALREEKESDERFEASPHKYVETEKPLTNKDYRVAAILAIVLGSFGAHKFYMGKTLMGILYLVFFWTWIPGIVGFVEGLIYLVKGQEDFNNRLS